MKAKIKKINLTDIKNSLFRFFKSEKTRKRASIIYGVVWNLTLLFFIVLLLGGGLAFGIGAGYFASLVKDEQLRSYDEMKKDIYNYEEISNVYFANGVYLGKLRSDLEREEVKLEDVSPYLIDAVIATEDEYFYEHNGVVPKAILRAIFQEVTNSQTQTGGSTLTQQLIKNQILSSEVSFERKAKEILLALRVEKFFEKDEILEAYLNVATFGRNSSGRNIAGVQSAAKGIFGVSAKELNLPQAAFIAGLPQSPFRYTPFTNQGTRKENIDYGLNRMKTVLQRMFENGKITKDQYEEALAYDITKDFIPPGKTTVQEYPFLTMEIEKRATEALAQVLAEKDGYTKEDLAKNDNLRAEYRQLAERDLRQNGYEIHTTIHKDIYDAMQKAKDQYNLYGDMIEDEEIDPETGEKRIVKKPVEVGAVLIENKTGRILSFVGGRDFSISQLNHAFSARRSNGSTMKPILVYAPAMEMGLLQPGSVLPDIPLKLNPQKDEPWPKNYGGSHSGLVSVRYAITKSYNIPAVKAYTDILDKRPAEYLVKMGFTSLHDEDFVNRSTAIGGLYYGVTVEENTNAFAALANGGTFVDAYMIEKIIDKNGKVVYQHKSEPVEVFSPQTAYLTLDIMRDVISEGTASSLNNRLKFRADWAGKTGTSQTYRDSWFVASNPNVTFGVWNGYDNNKPLQQTYKGYSYGVRNIYLWADLMNAAYDVNPELIAPQETFKMPGGIVRRSYCVVSGLLPSDTCRRAGLVETDLFKATYVPTEVDNNLIEGKYVEIGDKKYLALDSTPDDFAKSGLILAPDYAERVLGITDKDADLSELIPKKERWENVLLADDKITENGKAPSPLKIEASGLKITWKEHPHDDIIGYRVYKYGIKVASIPAGKELSYTGDNGPYFVTAVDIAGKESPPSNILMIGHDPGMEEPALPIDKPINDGEPEEPIDPGENGNGPSGNSPPANNQNRNNNSNKKPAPGD